MKAPAKRPAPTPAECNQLIALFNAGRHAELESRTRLLIEQYPDSGFAWKVLGVSLIKQGKEALFAFHKATELLPDDAEVHNNLGNALNDLGQLNDAVQSCRRALQIKPDFAEAHNNLGNALKDLGQLGDAVQSYRRALQISPNYAEVHSNLGNVLKDLGQLDDAAASYRRALEIKPDYAQAYSNLLYLHAFTRNISPELERSLAADWEKAVLNESGLAAARSRSFDNLPRAGRKLRVGIVSAELGQHPVAEFLEPILE